MTTLQLEILEREINEIEAERQRIQRQINPLQTLQTKLFEEGKKLQEQRGELLVKKMQAEGPDWKFLIKAAVTGEGGIPQGPASEQEERSDRRTSRKSFLLLSGPASSRQV